MLGVRDPMGQLAVLAGMLVLTAVAVLHPGLRATLARVGLAVMAVLREASGQVAAVYDAIIAINPLNGRPSRLRLALWIVILLGVALATLLGGRLGLSGAAALGAAVANAGLTLLNLMFLLGSYWALRESIDIMNADMAYHRHAFDDLSTAKSVTVIGAMSLVLLPQVAALMDWLQSSHGIELVRVRPEWGAPLSHLVAVVNALPFASLYVRLPGLADQSLFTPGVGSLWYAGLNAVGSLLIVGTLIGFVQQHLALRRMITSIVGRTDDHMLPLLQRRFLRAPSIIKSYVIEAIREETDEARRLKLFQMAVDRHAFSLPEFFIRRYFRWSQATRAAGARIVGEFVEQKGHKFDRAMLDGITDAATRAIGSSSTIAAADLQSIVRIVLPALERLAVPAVGRTAPDRAFGRRLEQRPVQRILASLMREDADAGQRPRALGLLMAAGTRDALPAMLRALPGLAEDQRVALLQRATELVADRGYNFPKGGERDPLSEMVRTIDWIGHNVVCSAAVKSASANLRAAIVARQKKG